MTRKPFPGEPQGRLLSDIAGIPQGLIADLESTNPARQRAALNNRAFQAYLITEGRRYARLRTMHYFRTKFSADESLTFRKVVAAIDSDREQWSRTGFVDDTKEGNALRIELLPGVDDDTTRLWLAKFCRLFLLALGRHLATYDPVDLGDDGFREKLLKTLVDYCSGLSDASLAQASENMGRIVNCRHPPSVCHYVDILHRPVWKKNALAAQQKTKDQVAQQAAEAAEKERVAAAEEARRAEIQHQLATEQCKFHVKDGCLYIGPSPFEPMEDLDGFKRLLASMQAAFAEARSVRMHHDQVKDGFRGERSIASMSAKQLACIKMELWRSRSGDYAKYSHSSYPENCMFALLNCDAGKEFADETSFTLFPLATAGLDTKLERYWLDKLDFLQTYIDEESFLGELARWFVEDRDDENGWATSR
ncbi:hypothetical protein ACQR1I_11670 [Bradyrhizobium sp. HKCCYLS2038]|uniref:hypothetical protein n=1 Tax=unclassified Bradyrhizobium TaxID=2631580 RepID=UPI003EC104F1